MISRRHALRVLGAACALPCLEACASQRRYRARIADDAIRVPRNELTHLRGPADALIILSARAMPILLRNVGDNTYVAVDARCPHSGCRVRAEPDGYVCPCHGSAFGPEGQVVTGPAQRSLHRYPTRLDGSDLTIRLETRSSTP